jgi:hypothetical protein
VIRKGLCSCKYVSFVSNKKAEPSPTGKHSAFLMEITTGTQAIASSSTRRDI